MENNSEQILEIKSNKIDDLKKNRRSKADKQKRMKAELYLERRRLRSLLGEDSLEFDHW